MEHRPNPLIDDRLVRFVLDDVVRVSDLCTLPYFSEHSRETFEMFLESVRRFARQTLFETYRPTDEAAPVLVDGRVIVHEHVKALYPRLVELGLLTATRPAEVGGSQLPLTVASMASLYLMAANLSVYAYVGLTAGAAHLIEAFGSEELEREYMERLYAGEWAGTMALTEPQAGSSLSDVTTRATPTGEGYYLIHGAKIFISGGDHDVTENVVNLALARIDGAPAGTKGISLFVVPKSRREGGRLVPNDVSVTGLIHKIGWKGLPSIALSFGENDDCRGWLVGEPHQGLKYMFQMMNEARVVVGANGVATASVAYHESVAYAGERPQGRPVTVRDPTSPQVPIVEHADVRRMLLRQKAIVEGGLCLLATTSRQADLAEHATDEASRRRAKRLLDLLTPVAKSFPAEWGFESNALAVQVHGGYGYSSEYLPEAWLRDQKLNSIHEGTTGIQAMDLLGRKVVAEGGAALADLGAEIAAAAARAREAGVANLPDALEERFARVAELTADLGGRGLSGDVEGMLLHAADYLMLFSILVVAWQWLLMAGAASERLAEAPDDARHHGTLQAARYFFEAELPRVDVLVELCRRGDRSYADMKPEWF